MPEWPGTIHSTYIRGAGHESKRAGNSRGYEKAPTVHVANLVLPLFAIILTGWFAGAQGYLPRALSAPLIQFAYNAAMPALIFLTIAQEPLSTLLDGRFLVAFGGGSAIGFIAMFMLARVFWRQTSGSSVMAGAVVSVNNTGFVALPILQALYGHRGVISGAIATAFVGAVIFPTLVVLLEVDRHVRSRSINVKALAKEVAFNPVVLSTVLGLAWSAAGLNLPSSVAAYLGIIGEALTPCALFAIGLNLSIAELRVSFRRTVWLTLAKLVALPLIVYGLCIVIDLGPTYTAAAVICTAVPTAKIAYILAGSYKVEEAMSGATVSMTTLFSVVTLLAWIYVLS